MTIDNKVYPYITKQLDKNSIVIDVGAYIGKVSKNICENSKGNPKNYYLIEACPNNFEILKQNCKKYNLYHTIISNKDGEEEFYISNNIKSKGSSQSNSLYKKFIKNKIWVKKLKSIKIKAYSLDSFIKNNNIQNIDFLKINCEGGEYKIFTSSTLDFLDKTKYIYLQMHGKNKYFLSNEIINLKIKINEILMKDYELILGDSPKKILKTKNHIHQLWRRK